MKKTFFILLAACTLMGCHCNKPNAECADSTTAQMHECVEGAVQFDSTVVYNLVAIKGEAVSAGATLQLNAEEGSLHGQSFVNNYFASFKATPCGKFFIENPATTMKAGAPEMEALERRLLEALGCVNRYQLGADKLELLQDETVVLTFQVAAE